MDQDIITVVSGLPRSGTSMMMQMLESGGLKILTDNLRTADEDNLRGYYEFENAKKLKTDQSWLEDAGGKVVKIISELLQYLPKNHVYKIIFMRRKMEEILASQQQMLVRRGMETASPISDEKMAEVFQKHLNQTEAWLAEQSNLDVLYVDYNEVLKNPADHIASINRFLGNALNEQKMVEVVDGALYRQRR